MIKHLRSSSSLKDRRRILDLIDNIDIYEDLVLFTTIVDACARLKDNRRLRQALEKFHQSGLRPNVHAYGTLIKAYGRCHDVKRAWALWNEMTKTRRLEPTNYTYGCMFDTLVSNGRMEEGISLFNSSLKKGRKASTIQYSILIKGCAQNKQVNEALALYEDMKARQISCNKVIYNTLINTCTSAGNLAKAEEIMANMKESPHFHPDVITYSTVMKGYCSQGRAGRAFELFNEMESLNIQPDAIVFNTLLEGCAKQMQVKTAEEVFQKMLERGISPSSFTLTILIKLYGKTNRFQKALQLADELPNEFGFEADAYVYTALIAACLTNGDINRALHYFEAINTGETRSVVSGRTFGTIITGCIRSNRYFKAYELLAEAHIRDLKVDSVVIQLLQQNFIIKQEEITSLCPVPISHHMSEIVKWLGNKVSRRHNTSFGVPPSFPEFMKEILMDIERVFQFEKSYQIQNNNHPQHYLYQNGFYSQHPINKNYPFYQ